MAKYLRESIEYYDTVFVVADIDANAARLIATTEALHAAVLPWPNEITIKFFR